MQGTWIQTDRADAVIQEKTITNGHWLVTHRDPNTRDIIFWVSGACHFEDGKFTEDYESSSDPTWQYLGTSTSFEVFITGNHLHQEWPDHAYHETFWRASAPTTLPVTRVEEALFPQFAHTWIYGGPPASPYTQGQIRQEFGLALMKDGTFSWKRAKRPAVIKGGWTITANDTGDHILHLRIDVAGLGTQLIKGQVLRWRAQIAGGQLTLTSLDGQADAVYTSKKTNS